MPHHLKNHETNHQLPRTSCRKRIKLTIKIIGLIAGLAGSFYAGGEIDDVFDTTTCIETDD